MDELGAVLDAHGAHDEGRRPRRFAAGGTTKSKTVSWHDRRR